ncbi:serine hydrolase [Curtobacterium flaccumfaciens]|nr:serine hydrolase [Curtobacterium flaccumfaciens]
MTDTLAAYRKTLPYIQDWVSYKVWQLRVPGVQVAIGYGGEVLFDEAWGYADVEAGRRLTTTDLFRIASHSKTFTSTALLQLAERGSLRLDDTVGTYVPALVDGGSPLADATIRELMEMGAGVIRDGHDGDYWSLLRPFPDEREAAGARPRPRAEGPHRVVVQLLEPRLLAARARHRRGVRPVVQRLRARVDHRTARPAQHRPDWDPTRADDFVVGYTGFHVARERRRIDHVDTRAMAAATGFHGTAGDLVKYFSQHVIGQGSLLDDHSKRLAQRKAWSATEDPAARGYGAGFIVDRIGGREIRGHSGGFPGHITQSMFDPASGLVVSVMTSAAAGPATLIATAIITLLDAAVDADAPGRRCRTTSTPTPSPGASRTPGASATSPASATGSSRSTRPRRHRSRYPPVSTSSTRTPSA